MADLPTSVNDRAISSFREGFYFQETSLRSFAKIKPSRKFPNLQYLVIIDKPVLMNNLTRVLTARSHEQIIEKEDELGIFLSFDRRWNILHVLVD